MKQFFKDLLKLALVSLAFGVIPYVIGNLIRWLFSFS